MHNQPGVVSNNNNSILFNAVFHIFYVVRCCVEVSFIEGRHGVKGQTGSTKPKLVRGESTKKGGKQPGGEGQPEGERLGYK